jgi:cyclopropane-fatty-acyl-phospholipid synthase
MLVPPIPPPQEALPDWRRWLEGMRHSRRRDAEAIHHHYDVSNRFYELLLGESMTYTCACYPTEEATLEEAQAHKYDLVARKLALRPGMRLLDVGCGWGGMVIHAARNYGVRALGVTLSREQALWAGEAIKRAGLDDVAEVRHLDYREVTESGFDAISSIGLTEHIGVRNYPGYFRFLLDRLRPGGRLLNHCITRPENTHAPRVSGGFIDRYVFPDGELTGSGRIIAEIQNAGFEVRHEENLREHYARTCAAWCDNLVANWRECVAEAGEPTAKVWGLYLAGSRLGFEHDQIQLHQVLAVQVHPDGRADVPLRPDWGV